MMDKTKSTLRKSRFTHSALSRGTIPESRPQAHPRLFTELPAPTGDAQSASVSNLSVSGTHTSPGLRARKTYADITKTPFPLIEFGVPTRAYKPRFAEPVLPSDKGEQFLKSPAGAKLMAENSVYTKTVHQYAIRACRLHGRRLLVLGSGSSSSMLSLVSRGPSMVTFVDKDEAVLARLSKTIDSVGLNAASIIEYRADDANNYLAYGGDGAKFDVVLCTKALGQILEKSSAIQGFMDSLLGLLNPGADVLVDQHDAYQRGTTIGNVATRDDYGLATVGGRFSSDVCYSLQAHFDGYECVGTFRSSLRKLGPQVWTLFHFRTAALEAAPTAHVLSTPPPRVTPIVCPQPSYDPVGDVAVPLNARGAKAVVADQDRQHHSLGAMYPKIDGVPGVLHVTARGLLFLSSLYRFFLPAVIPTKVEYEVLGELVRVGPRAIIVVTGLLSVNDSDADPLDVSSLAGLEKEFSGFGKFGLVVNSPALLRHVVGDSITLAGPSGPLLVPVDGVHVSDGRQNGLFFKPAPHCTVDATPEKAGGLISDASDITGSGVVTVEPPPDDSVWEYARKGDVWFPVRSRVDKKKSDRPGQVVHTMIAQKSSAARGLNTVEQLIKYLRD